MKVVIRSATLLFCALLATSSLSHAEESRSISGSKIRLSDLVESLPDDMPDVELGAAPPPGSSRLMPKKEIESALGKRGLSAKNLKLPQLVRISSAAKRWSTDELVAAALPQLARSLPNGVGVKHAKTSARVVTSPGAVVSDVRLPKLPRKEGDFLTTAIVELSNDGELVARVPFTLALDIGKEAAQPSVAKGARVQLVIENGPARIAATAIALADGEIGETVQFRVAATQKVLFGKLESSSVARVVQ